MPRTNPRRAVFLYTPPGFFCAVRAKSLDTPPKKSKNRCFPAEVAQPRFCGEVFSPVCPCTLPDKPGFPRGWRERRGKPSLLFHALGLPLRLLGAPQKAVALAACAQSFSSVAWSAAKPAPMAAFARPAFAPPPYIPARARGRKMCAGRKIGVDIVYAE